MSEDIDPKRSAQELYATALVRERTRARLTQAALGQHPGVFVSPQQIGHLEKCRRPPTLRLSRGLDAAFGLDEFFEALYEAYVRENGTPPAFWEYAELEPQASLIRVYSNFLIPGLLQTEETTRAILRAGQKPECLDQVVAARMERQEILRREDPPVLLVRLDEYAVRRRIGDPETKRRQLEHLLELMQRPNIDIVIVPDGAPIFPVTSFTILSLPDGRPDLGYADSIDGRGSTIEPGPDLIELAVTFERIGSRALSIADSEKLIRALLEDM
ncbi:Scr1 family TA system antitoxin-like transcriptional regulator [Actinomadura scrupuli]|uniref:Scr1 family TA system antitoxin-like transcriptional regulator n=1 Tax=Actinomadura scrupuli TaxID=559629 RepID=UPI003D959B1F